MALAARLGAIARSEHGDAPATILILSGDVHHGYLAEAEFDGGAESRVYQAVSSALRNSLPGKKSRLQERAWTVPASLAGRVLARLSGVWKEPLHWRLTHEAAFFENQVATRRSRGRHHLREGRAGHFGGAGSRKILLAPARPIVAGRIVEHPFLYTEHGGLKRKERGRR
jgi:hypothetical protein